MVRAHLRAVPAPKLTLPRVQYFNGTIDNILPFTYNDAVSLWLWSSAACDVAISLCFAFTLHRRIQGFNANTDTLLKKLIQTALRTAAYTAVLAVGGGTFACPLHGDARADLVCEQPL